MWCQRHLSGTLEHQIHRSEAFLQYLPDHARIHLEKRLGDFGLLCTLIWLKAYGCVELLLSNGYDVDENHGAAFFQAMCQEIFTNDDFYLRLLDAGATLQGDHVAVATRHMSVDEWCTVLKCRGDARLSPIVARANHYEKRRELYELCLHGEDGNLAVDLVEKIKWICFETSGPVRLESVFDEVLLAFTLSRDLDEHQEVLGTLRLFLESGSHIIDENMRKAFYKKIWSSRVILLEQAHKAGPEYLDRRVEKIAGDYQGLLRIGRDAGYLRSSQPRVEPDMFASVDDLNFWCDCRPDELFPLFVRRRSESGDIDYLDFWSDCTLDETFRSSEWQLSGIRYAADALVSMSASSEQGKPILCPSMSLRRSVSI